VDAKKVKRVLVCNGQFYYEIKTKRDELKIDVKIKLNLGYRHRQNRANRSIPSRTPETSRRQV